MSDSFSRDAIQGFIDGYIYAGGDPSSASNAVSEWMDNHPIYRAQAPEKTAILQDVKSYRVTNRSVLAPSSVIVEVSPVIPS